MKQLQKVGLYIYFFSINFEVWDPFYTNGFFSISKLTAIFYFITMIPLIIYSNSEKEIMHILRPIFLFFVIFSMVNIYNINFIYSNFFDFTLFQNIILFWLLIKHERYDEMILEKGMLSFALGSIVLSFLFYLGIGIDYNEGRVSIFGDNENSIGIRMCISAIVLCMVILQNRLNLSKGRYLLLLPIPLILGLMTESGSRLAILSFILVFIASLILYKTSKIWGKVFTFIIGIVALFFVLQFLFRNEVLKVRLLQSLNEGNLSGRDIIWEKILPLIKSNPIFGVGKTGYGYYAQSMFGEYKSPHNVILEVICFTGILGLVIFLIFLYRIFRRGFECYKLNGILLPLLLTIISLGLLASSHVLEVKIGWAIFAYISSTSALRTNISSI